METFHYIVDTLNSSLFIFSTLTPGVNIYIFGRFLLKNECQDGLAETYSVCDGYDILLEVSILCLIF